MTLEELLERLDELDDDHTIFVDKSAGLSSKAPVAVSNTETGPPPAGFSYVLEVYLAKEVLEVWTQWRGGRKPSLEEKCRAVIWYAEKDSYVPIEADG
jgi:hypothetical protein